ncbi:MAG: regulatory protein RecX [Tepidiformaceae bacterium]
MDDLPASTTVTAIRAARRGRQVTIELSDGQTFLCSEEACTRAGVVAGAEVTPETLAALEAAEQRVLAHEAALRLLSHRARSEREIRQRLAQRGVIPDAVEAEVRRLREAGLVDDEKFARAWVEDRRQSAPRGRRMLRYELLSRGIATESIDQATEGVDDLETARALALRKGRAVHATEYEAFFAKVGNFLRGKGFDYAVAAEATRAAWAELDDRPRP